MADKKTDLSIVIEAVNNASKQLKQVEKDLGGLSGAVNKQGQEAQTAALGFGSLVAGVAAGTIAANIATSAFQKLTSIIASIPRAFFGMAVAASEVEGLGIAMHIVANNAGIMAKEVDNVRDAVIEQNITTKAANRLLLDLIRNQLDYTQATELASAAQNIAAAAGIDSSEAIERISQSISSGRTWLLRQMGLVEHLDGIYARYGQTLGKTSEEMTEAERKQSVVNYILQEGAKYAGAYEASMGNAAKVLRSLQRAQKEISYVFGRIFNKALFEVSNTIYKFADGMAKWGHENEAALATIGEAIGVFMSKVVNSVKGFIKSIPWGSVISALSWVVEKLIVFTSSLKIVSNAIQIFARATAFSINNIKSLGDALSALISGDFKALKQVYVDWSDYSTQTGESIKGDLKSIGDAFSRSHQVQGLDLREWWKKIGETDSKGWEDRLKEAEEGGEKLTAKQKNALKKMQEDLEKANRDYQRAVEKRTKMFEESFEDLVLTHRDEIKNLTEDLEEEVEEYQGKLTDLVGDFDEAMEEIESRHREKTESVMEDMEDERKKAEEEIEAITEKYNEATTLVEREAEARLGNLKAQLDKEKALGDNADKDKISSLEQMIANEERGLATTMEERKAKYDEEVSDVDEALNEKLSKLQEELEKEDSLFTEAIAKRKVQYDEDVTDAKESYEEKRQALQEELDEETVIREKYADDFARLADTVAESDLDRLIRKHNEEMFEMARDHGEKLAEIEKKAFEQGETFAQSFADGIDSGYPAVKNQLNQIEGDIDRITAKAGAFNFGGGKSGGYGASGSWGEPIGYGQMGGVFSKPTIVGEAGPEVVLPLNFPKRMAQIMQSMGMGGDKQGQVVQNFYVTVQDRQDVDVLMERAGFALKQGGGYS